MLNWALLADKPRCGMVFGAYGSHTQGIAPGRNATTCLGGNGEVVGMVGKQGTIGWKRCEEQGATFRDSGAFWQQQLFLRWVGGCPAPRPPRLSRDRRWFPSARPRRPFGSPARGPLSGQRLAIATVEFAPAEHDVSACYIVARVWALSILIILVVRVHLLLLVVVQL